MKKLDELERKYEELGKEIEKLKSDDKLRLEVSDDCCLGIRYKGSPIGVINSRGECVILSTSNTVNTYEQWRADGMPVDESVVEWRGGKYRLVSWDIKSIYLERIDIDYGCIYDFDGCKTIAECEDSNIKRFKHNKKPIIY